ncbi:MetQ/NlpA family ABC transporter substrate-binding protein [Kroppenstedtia pulmonis]|uniref:Lipoprotein n=1 Tax=Kroppenstedtia pulmonis TaxID=1380685 RepID=A0A7D3XR35_9BACL|nr:MetQ/NlpA family ABC transporter substrate-binding protein [Kroppenstedtia pulmonis]QKG83968.1 MetQ/NlpA family ABC transporter substrate-binding protein [Kroppenstedtia pulmonis]
MKKWRLLAALSVFVLVLSGCSGKEKDTAGKKQPLPDDKLVIGVTAGPHEEIMEKVKEVAGLDGLTIELKVFNEYVMPNVALAEKELDANSFQTRPYFDQFKKDRNLDLVAVMDTVTFPMGIYSNNIKDINKLPQGARVGVPNDPANEARALQLFEKAGLITLKEGAGEQATPGDIEKNPKKLQFVELEASQLPRQLDELDGAAINTNFAIEHGFLPAKDSIFMEGKDSPHVNLIAVRTENKDDPVLKKLKKAYHSDEVKSFVEKNFKGSVLPSW